MKKEQHVTVSLRGSLMRVANPSNSQPEPSTH
jgi:hypothetical protein